jgi:hypothetical protein
VLKALQHDLKAAKAQLSQSTSALQTLEVERARLVEQVSPLEGERSRVSGLGLRSPRGAGVSAGGGEVEGFGFRVALASWSRCFCWRMQSP